MNSQLEIKVLNLLRALAAMYKPSLLESAASLDMYLDQLESIELSAIEEAIKRWNSTHRTMPLPGDLRELAMKHRQQKLLPGDSVCPTCKNNIWALCYTERGSTAAEKCFKNGIHTLDPEALEERNRNNLARGIHRLLNGQTEKLQKHLQDEYSTSSLLELSSGILARLYRHLNNQLVAS